MRRNKIIRGQFIILDFVTIEDKKKTKNKKDFFKSIKKLADKISREKSDEDIKAEGEQRRVKAGIKKGEHIKAHVLDAPKALVKQTEKYMNSPYYYNLHDAFKKAAGEYKNPSKRLKDALLKDDFRYFIPSAYNYNTDANGQPEHEGMIKRKPYEYSFRRYIGQKVRDRHGEHVIKKIESFYTEYEDRMVGTPHDMHPVNDSEYLNSLTVEREYNEWLRDTSENAETRNTAIKNLDLLEKAIKKAAESWNDLACNEAKAEENILCQ